MGVQAWFDEDDREVEPGTACTLVLSLEHLGDDVTTYAVTATGLGAGWTTVTRPTVVCTPGSRDDIEVHVRPPRSPATPAGPTTVAVRVTTPDDPDVEVVAEATVRVLPFDDRRVIVLQPAIRSRRRARFELLVENHGNELASCRLHLVDRSGRVDGSFDPPAVGVPPGGATLAQLRARAVGGRMRRHERQLEFTVEATQPDHDAAVAHGALVQPPTIPGRWIAAVVSVVALVGGLAVAWTGVVRPELRDAADRAVAERLADADTGPATTVVSPGAEPVVTTTTVADDPTAERGEPFLTRLQALPGPGGTSADDHVVAADRRLELTDVVLQNRTADIGWVTLAVDDQVLYEWDLAVLDQPNEFQPRIAPIPVPAGGRIEMRVACEAPGDPALGTCDVAVLLGGRSFPA